MSEVVSVSAPQPQASTSPAAPPQGKAQVTDSKVNQNPSTEPKKTPAEVGKENAPTQKQMQKELAEADLDALVTVKINGETKKLTVKEVMRLNQLEQASRDKLNEANQLKKQAQEFAKFAKTNPKAFMEKLGIDPYEFAEATLAEKIQMMEMTPEEIEYQELKREKEALKQREAEEADLKKKDEESQAVRNAEESLSKELAEAFRESGLPNSKLYFEQITAQMLYADKIGKPLSAKEAAAKVKQGFDAKHREHVRTLDAKAILELLGDAKWNELREFDLARVSSVKTPLISESTQRPDRERSVPQKARSGMSKPMTPEEFSAWLESR